MGVADMVVARRKKVKTAYSAHGMVSTASKIATDAGVQMLENGGNAVDAAVAAAFCLGVTEPQASGLGGQSMALLHMKNGSDEPSTFVLDGSSRAPFSLDPSRHPSQPLKVGVKATTVPSTPATLGYMLETYGTLPLKDVLKPSITAAREGFKISALQHTLLSRESEKLREDEQVKAVFFKNGSPLNAGDVVRQSKLADTLELMANQGWLDYYLGNIAARIIADMEKRGGLISEVDLRQIPFPIQREVLKESYRGYDLHTFPPPGAGRALVQILNTLECFTREELSPRSALAPVIMAMAFRAALMNRERFPMDPALYPQLPDKWLLDKENTRRVAERIRNMTSYRVGKAFYPPPATGETTHLSVADKFGNIVGITQSVELVFGAKTMAGELGFFYNNYMSAFDYKNMMHPCYLLPGGRPWSSVAPTLIFQGERPFMLLGSPGSERISTTLAQVIVRVIDGDQDLADAVEAPRLHAGSSGKVMIEKRRFTAETLDALTRTGFKVSERGEYSFYLGCVQAVMFPQHSGGEFYGVSDPRRDGTARGPKFIKEAKELQ